MNPLAALNRIETIATLTKEALAINEKLQDSSLKLVLAQLQNETANALLEGVTLKKRILALEEEIEQLKEQEAPTVQTFYKGELLYKKNGEQETGPFCSVCFGKSGDKNFIPVQRLNGDFSMFGTHSCNICKTNFGKGTGGGMMGRAW